MVMRQGYIQSPQFRLLKFPQSLPKEHTRANTVGTTVIMMVKSFSNVVGLFKFLVWPSGGTPLGRVQRSTPGNREAKPEPIVVSGMLFSFLVFKKKGKKGRKERKERKGKEIERIDASRRQSVIGICLKIL